MLWWFNLIFMSSNVLATNQFISFSLGCVKRYHNPCWWIIKITRCSTYYLDYYIRIISTHCGKSTNQYINIYKHYHFITSCISDTLNFQTFPNISQCLVISQRLSLLVQALCTLVEAMAEIPAKDFRGARLWSGVAQRFIERVIDRCGHGSFPKWGYPQSSSISRWDCP